MSGSDHKKVIILNQFNHEIIAPLKESLKNNYHCSLYETSSLQNFNSYLAKELGDVAIINIDPYVDRVKNIFTEIKKINPHLTIISLSKNEEIEPHTLIDIGIYNHFKLPLVLEHFNSCLNSVLPKKITAEEQELEKSFFIGKSEKFISTIKIAQKMASKNISLLVTGESGTGKGYLANYIHALSKRKDNPFVSVNCPAIPGNLAESELFGHMKGAFTGAVRDKEGLLESAESGTIFFDEVADLGFDVQSKLLRFIQDREFERLGDTQKRSANVRIISATSINLEELIKNKAFRLDLFYRLSEMEIRMPSLRERKEDIPALITFMANEYCKKIDHPQVTFELKIFSKLKLYDWPGNLRELSSIIRRMIILSGTNLITYEQVKEIIEGQLNITDDITSTNNPITKDQNNILDFSLKNNEKRIILAALEASKHNHSKACELLEIGRATLYRKLKKYSL